MLREEYINAVRLDLIGPSSLDDEKLKKEQITENPLIKYLSGILEPIQALSDSQNQDDEPEKNLEDALSAISQSSMGLTFRLPFSANLKITIEFGIYELVKQEQKRFYVREPHVFEVPLAVSELDAPKIERTIFRDERKSLSFVLIKKREAESNLFILSVVNSERKEEEERPKFSECFFQVAATVESDKAFLNLNVSGNRGSRDEQLNALLYYEFKRYANGHGCSVFWNDREEEVRLVGTTFLPSQTIDKVNHRVLKPQEKTVAFKMVELSKSLEEYDWLTDLNTLGDEYKNWLNSSLEESFPEEFSSLVLANESSCQDVLERLRRGVEVLKNDERARLAFRLMNQAMLLQQLRSSVPLQEFSQESRYAPIDIDDSKTWPENFRMGSWRLFQIAFILMNISSMAEDGENYNPDNREIFDLIWFPTGGGKTEAYLGLSAFTLFYERLGDAKAFGVSILMRYTLRLLSSQQFERAASLIVACNDIARIRLPKFPEISLGLWVGINITPNKGQDAQKALEAMANGEGNPFVITKCPRCSTEFAKKQYGLNGYREKDVSIEMHCKVCNSPEEAFPIYVVDEDIRQVKPSMLIGTVDKFAMLTWDPSNRLLLGVDVPSYGENTPLKLIIQDELHLIDGPLGTIVGLYEMGLDFIFSLQGKRKPKRIGSTATISMAYEQLKSLYAKEEDEVQFFPQPLVSAKDNFFSFQTKDDRSRKYVGLFMNSSPSYKTSQYRSISTLLQSSHSLILEKDLMDSEEESYRTLIGYFNTLKDLGHTKSMLADDVPQHLKLIHRSQDIPLEEKRYLNDYGVVELTSRESSSDIKRSLDRLFTQSSEKGFVDVCLATNMISVGVDVPRLSTMLINKQPKSTAEYIQASSRVGRGAVPGVVFVLYAPNRARDRSQFEQFQFFHRTLQKNVEPATLTPFANPARLRALPGVIFMVLRNAPNTSHRDAPSGDIEDGLFGAFEDFVIQRCTNIDSEELSDLQLQLKEFKDTWKEGFERYPTFLDDALAGPKAFEQFNALGVNNQRPKPYKVLTSMRSVDIEEKIEVIK